MSESASTPAGNTPKPSPVRRRWWDSLFLRIFLFMWVVLVVSHVVAFTLALPLGTGRGSALERLEEVDRFPMAALPPTDLLNNPRRGPEMRQGPASGQVPVNPQGERGFGDGRRFPATALWLDYGLRALIIAMGAAVAARWLSTPLRKLAGASGDLSRDLAQGKPLPRMDEEAGTVEVRDMARSFNQMAEKLQHQFNQRSLHMAAVSHDLRTPLTRLRLRVEQLPSEAAVAASRDIAEMDELIDASLAVMKEQAGGIQSQRMDLTSLVQSMVDDRSEQGQAVSFIELDAPVLPVQVHAASVRRIVDNLVSNALRYGKCARLSVDTESHWAVLHVDDDGPGIAPTLREQAFQPWVRLAAHPDQRQDVPQGGSGLGLAIARDLAEREGGTLELANRQEGGLRATLRLPLA